MRVALLWGFFIFIIDYLFFVAALFNTNDTKSYDF